MALRKFVPSSEAPSISMKAMNFSRTMHENTRFGNLEMSLATESEVDIDLREVYFLIMHFLSAGPCRRTYGQFWNELLEHQLLPRRYHAWYSRNGACSGDDNDDGMSFPLSYNMLMERYSHVEKDHLVKLLKQLILSTAPPSRGVNGGNAPNAADVPTLMGTGSFSLLSCERDKVDSEIRQPPAYMRWPHMKADQVRGLSLREIGGGFSRHHRAPSIRAASYAIAKPSTMVQKMQNIKRLRGHRNAVYCAIFDRTGRHVITGSDDRLVKIWSMETAYCLASCRGHEGDITDLAVSSNDAVVASSSNDCIIRVWRLPDGLPISVLRGHTGAVTAIAFSPRPGFVYQLLSSSDDGTCRIWDARNSQLSPRLYVPRPSDNVAGRNNGPSSSAGAQNHQIFCCAFNSSGTVFVTGSSDTLARVWSASKTSADDSDQPSHEIDVLSGHENDVNYVQFSGHAVTSRFMTADALKEDVPKFKNSWFTHDNIVTCSRDGSAIIWIPRSRRSHVKACRWTRAYHLKVPPPPMPPQPPRGGPRQRILPTPRGVNMIIWSLDNRFVLAAIMDCRICVWNASDGSLVHSLTGHTESTYVLDVHPFNPRIAMSAGYDGRTIVWDIWEGKPIRIYEMSRFKLVDGKFSPDGTSIILSDDVGQLYVLNTGQGESQKDAKYDQFFLGDYRPLIQDTYGNVLDQETQITPFRRNMQDLLCDSAMIPYPEPYQSEYQQRRLGALGLEWKPSSLKLATGPDFTLDPDFQIMPLADLDIMVEPLPDFLDAMDWEPEIEMHSDDNDSEYNVPEGYSTGGAQGTLSSNSSDDSECSTEDGETEDTQLDRLRRSKRKKQKAETEVMTSSGRRVKRRNFDEGDGNQLRNHRNRKSKSGRKASQKKSSSKSLRPQRAAARNALTLFSKITGTSTDGEDEEGSGVDTSESESTLQDSNIESDGSDKYLQNEQEKHMKGKGILVDESEEFVEHRKVPESRMNAGNRTRLVLRLPIRESNKLVVRESIVSERDDQVDLVGQSSNFPQEVIAINGNSMNSEDSLESPGGDAKRSSIGGLEEAVQDKVDRFSLSEGYKNGTIRWGGVKARSSKRLRLGEATTSNALSGTNLRLQDRFEKDNDAGGSVKTEIDSAPDVRIRKHVVGTDGVVMTDRETVGDNTCSMANGLEHSTSTKFGKDEKSKSCDMATCNETASSVNDENRANIQLEQSDKPQISSTKLRLKVISGDPESPCNQETKSVGGNLENGRCESLHEKSLDMEEDLVVPEVNPTNRIKSDHGDGALESSTHCDKNAEFSVKDLTESRLHKDREKMYIAVYKRSRSHKGKSAVVGDADGKGGSTSNVSNNNLSVGEDSDQSNGLKASTCNPNVAVDDVELDQGLELGHNLRNTHNAHWSRHQVPHEEWGSSSRMTVGLRSARNRRGSYHAHDTSPINVRKPNKPTKKGTWLMLTTHERGFRYIPQLGDEVVYLRQGHQEYLEHNRLREHPPWTSIKVDIRDVELCKVQKLDYSSLPGSGECCCKMMLEFIDPASSVYGRSFKMTLPEMTGFPDFLVERTRYDAAVQRNWTRRDKCKVWWSDDSEEDGNWWVGRIISVQAKSNEFPDSPWESCTVQYKTNPVETHLHSPWELFEINEPWEHPHIDKESKENLMAAFAKLEKLSKPSQDRYGINHLKQLSQRTNFTNRFPVPISFEVIECRLENNYYRSLEAVKHDFQIMLSNAEQYLGNKPEFSIKFKRLSEWLTKTFSSL